MSLYIQRWQTAQFGSPHVMFKQAWPSQGFMFLHLDCFIQSDLWKMNENVTKNILQAARN